MEGRGRLVDGQPAGTPRRPGSPYIVVLLVAGFLLSACAGPVAAQQTPPGGTLAVPLPATWSVTTGDGAMATARLAPATTAGAVDRALAIRQARRHVPAATAATPVSAQLLQLTLDGIPAADNGQPVLRRTVWLISFRGVRFSAFPSCECVTLSAQPNTDVAIGAASGGLVAWFGAP